ncbi:MAG: GH116 family glycosyl hydrolase, partial [Bacteroidota bacterium]
MRSISVTPEVTTLTYTYESFAIREHILVPRDEPGVIILLEVHTTQPLTMVAGFLPVMQPMWPAGIGGQFSYWDDGANAFVISEGQWRSIFLCGSPAGQQMAAPPAHMFADNPLQFKIEVKPDSSDGLFFPIVIAGALPSPETGKTKMDSVKATYARLWKNAERYYRENEEYYRKLRQTTMQVVTPDKQFNLAYEWGKVALDNLMTVNPRLGYGMVAGFGLSGGGARPGFSWFFGGDAFINSLAMNGYGDFQKVRDALAFTQKWQRQDNFPIRKKNPGDPPKDVGKMAHELSQSDGLCDWWNDYHYGYNHADTTPWYIVAMGDYVRASGDTEFLRTSWKSVKQAYDWCLSKDTDGDGLMDLKGAGLGALEFGKLVGIYADVYTCGVWVQAIKEMRFMGEIVGDREAVQQAKTQL